MPLMKVAVAILIILALAVAGLLVAIFWDQLPGSGNYEVSIPYETPEPPPGPSLADAPANSGSSPAETPAPANDPVPEPGPVHGPGSAGSAPGSAESPAPAPIEKNPDEIPPPDMNPAEQKNEDELNDRRSIMLMQAEELYLAGKYDEALELLRKDETLFNDDTARLELEILIAMR